MIMVNMVTLVGNAFVIVALTKIDALKHMANNQVVISLGVADLLVLHSKDALKTFSLTCVHFH